MSKKKNIILILSDQQRYDTVSAYGLNDICKTPHIDTLAKEGMKFTNAFTSSPICAPARASVMTGLYPHNHGVIDNFTDIKDDKNRRIRMKLFKDDVCLIIKNNYLVFFSKRLLKRSTLPAA